MKKIIFLPSAFSMFNGIVLFLFLLPTLFIVLTGDVSQLYGETSRSSYLNAANLFLVNIILSMSTFLICYYSVSGKLILSRSFFSITAILESKVLLQKKYSKISRLLLYLAVISTALFFYYVGFSKLSLLGSGIDAWKYRMIGFDDTPHILQIINETARRIFLPFLLVVELIRSELGLVRSKANWVLYLILLTYVVGVISTLDRAPLMALIVAFIFVHLVVSPSKKKFFIISLSSIFLLGIMASIMTYLQYNILDVDLSTVIVSAQDFLFHRVLMVPSIAAIQLSFENFPIGSDFLHLKYSRLGAIIGNQYIGTEQALSLYVTPVGFIADSWRNGGFFLVFFTSLLLGGLSAWVDISLKRCSWILQVAIIFLFFSFMLFLVFGVFYSQGAFAQMLFIVFLVVFFNRGSALKRSARANPFLKL